MPTASGLGLRRCTLFVAVAFLSLTLAKREKLKLPACALAHKLVKADKKMGLYKVLCRLVVDSRARVCQAVPRVLTCRRCIGAPPRCAHQRAREGPTGSHACWACVFAPLGFLRRSAWRTSVPARRLSRSTTSAWSSNVSAARCECTKAVLAMAVHGWHCPNRHLRGAACATRWGMKHHPAPVERVCADAARGVHAPSRGWRRPSRSPGSPPPRPTSERQGGVHQPRVQHAKRQKGTADVPPKRLQGRSAGGWSRRRQPLRRRRRQPLRRRRRQSIWRRRQPLRRHVR